MHPETNNVYYFKKGLFMPYETLAKKVDVFKDLHSLIETAKAMKTNNIVNATK